MLSKETEVRYTALWNKINANGIKLSDLDKMTQQQFYNKIGSTAKSTGMFNLAKSLARNMDRQNSVNTYVKSKGLPKSIIPTITPKEYIPQSYRLTFKKSQYGLSGYKKKSASHEYQTRNAEEIGVKLSEFKNKLKDSNSKELQNPNSTKHFSVNQKTEILITNPDATTEIKTFFYNGKLFTDSKRSLNQTYKAKRKLRKFIEVYGRNNVKIGNTTLSIREIYI